MVKRYRVLKSYGADHLDVVLVTGFLERLLGNARTLRYLTQNHMELLREFEKIIETGKSAA